MATTVRAGEKDEKKTDQMMCFKTFCSAAAVGASGGGIHLPHFNRLRLCPPFGFSPFSPDASDLAAPWPPYRGLKAWGKQRPTQQNVTWDPSAAFESTSTVPSFRVLAFFT
jgi:hypothetical protein